MKNIQKKVKVMSKLREYLFYNHNFMLSLGVVLLVVLYLPMLILEDDALFIMHDQLDGEVLTYILSANNWQEDSINVLFDGVSKTALTPASLGSVLFYLIFSPLTAFLVNYMFVAVASYVGMFLCLKELNITTWLCMSISVLYAILPFYSVYGLSVMGQPLLVYAFFMLHRNKSIFKSYGLIVFFGFFSSLVLVGYADLIILMCITVFLWIRKNKDRFKFAGGMFLLMGIYLVTNYQLIGQIVFQNTKDISHKTEMVANSSSFLSSFSDMFVKGYYHAASKHSVILLLAIIIVAIILYKKCFCLPDWFYKAFVLIFGFCFLIALFYAFWSCPLIVDIRNKIGGLFVYFQIDRFYWLYPCLWFGVLGLIFYFIENMVKIRYLKQLFNMLILVAVFMNVYLGGPIKANVEKMLLKNNEVAGYETWARFYSEELFNDIKDYIGKPCSDYKVGSIGLYPSIALYNGLYCIDGYSNNYSVNYKHEFRKVIENELEKNESLKSYYDGWGNRCYLFVAEIPYMYTIHKDSGIILKNIDLNINALKELNCDYLLSAAEIDSPNMEGKIELCKVFENSQSPYSVYLYEII